MSKTHATYRLSHNPNCNRGELIAGNKCARSPFLDLDNLGLLEVPLEVFDCV